jgi:hypothetical protein
MGWDLDTLPQRLQNVTLSTQQVPIDSSSCIDSQDFNRAANFTDIISSELVLICIAGYLPVPSLLSLSSTTKDIRAVMHSTPGVWRTCDFTDFLESSQDCSQKNLVKFLRQHYVSRDCRVLILDGLAFDHQFLDNLLLREMPALHSISLLSCPDLNGDQLIKLIDYIRRPSAEGFGWRLSVPATICRGSFILWGRLLAEATLTGAWKLFRSLLLHKARPQMLL